jgi:putative membrane protein
MFYREETIVRSTLPLLLLLPVAAWSQAPQRTPDQDGSGADLRTFVQRTAQFDMTQAHLGKLAQEKAASQQVKNYGSKLEKSHTEAYNRLGGLAATTPFTLPKAIDAQHQKIVQRFEKLSGAQFDRAFTQEQIQSHRDTLQWLQQQQNSPNEQVKQQASRLIPEFQNHLQDAQALGNQNSSNAANSPAASNQDSNLNTSDDQHRSGTVTRYEPGKTLEVKVRDRIGRHRYNLSSISANIPADLKTGDMVAVSEHVDSNGTRTLTVERTSGTSSETGHASRAQRGNEAKTQKGGSQQ